jgi:hypothetical protein
MAQDLIAETKTIEPTFAKRLNDLPKDWNKVIDSSVLLAEKQLLFAKKVKELCLEAERLDAKKKGGDDHKSLIRETVQELIGSVDKSIFSRWQKIGEFADALMPHVKQLPPSRDTLYQLSFAIEKKKPYEKWIKEEKITPDTSHQSMLSLVKDVAHKAKAANQRYLKVTLLIDGETSQILKLLRPVLSSKLTKSIKTNDRLKIAINDDLTASEKKIIQGKLSAGK